MVNTARNSELALAIGVPERMTRVRLIQGIFTGAATSECRPRSATGTRGCAVNFRHGDWRGFAATNGPIVLHHFNLVQKQAAGDSRLLVLTLEAQAAGFKKLRARFKPRAT
jgi:hypothetical protein